MNDEMVAGWKAIHLEIDKSAPNYHDAIQRIRAEKEALKAESQRLAIREMMLQGALNNLIKLISA